MSSFRGVGLTFFIFTACFCFATPALGQDADGSRRANDSVAAAPQLQAQSVVSPNRDRRIDVVFFVGGLVGGDFFNVLDGDFSLANTLENGRTYGGRVGYYRWPFGVEGSFAHSDTGLALEADLDADAKIRVGARTRFVEANGLLLLIPGPVQPFLTGGGGLHSYEFFDLQGIKLSTWGWNFGFGVKGNIKRVVVRLDIRDHLTRVTAADLGVTQELADLLGIADQDLHNVEISFGAGVRF